MTGSASRRSRMCSGRCSTARSLSLTIDRSRLAASLRRARSPVGLTAKRGDTFMTHHTPRLSRRDWLTLTTAGIVGYSMSGWLEALAADAAKNPQRKRACILLWMNGGPSQTDTFDLKPGHKNGGPFKEIQTSASGLKFSEHLPKIAKFGDRLAIVRSMTTKEAHPRPGRLYMRTG